MSSRLLKHFSKKKQKIVQQDRDYLLRHTGQTEPDDNCDPTENRTPITRMRT